MSFRSYIFPEAFREGCGHISNYSSFLQIREISGKLSEAETALFRSTVFSHLLDIPKDQNWCSPIFNFLFSRLIKAEPEKTKDGEIWFRIFDQEICFGKREFAAISGLSIRRPGEAFVPPNQRSILMDKHFTKEDELITGMRVKKFLLGDTVTKEVVEEGEVTKDPVKVNAEDRAKAALLWVVQCFVYGNLPNVGIELETWHLVDNLVEFNKIPWGERAYEIFVEKTVKAYANFAEKHPTLKPNVKPHGMAHVLVVRVFVKVTTLTNVRRICCCDVLCLCCRFGPFKYSRICF